MLTRKCFSITYPATNRCCGFLEKVPTEIMELMYASVKNRFEDAEFNNIAGEIVADVKCYGTWLTMEEWTSRKKEIHTYFEGMKKLYQLGHISKERMDEIYREYPDKAKVDGWVLEKKEEEKLLTDDDAKKMMARLSAISFIKSIDKQNESK